MLTVLPFRVTDLDNYGRGNRSIRIALSVLMLRDFLSGLTKLNLAVEGAVTQSYDIDPFIFPFAPLVLDVMPLLAFSRIFWDSLEVGPTEKQSLMEQLNWKKWVLLGFFYLTAFVLVIYSINQSCFSKLGSTLGIPAVTARAPVRALLLSPLLLFPRIQWLIGKLTDTSFGTFLPLGYLPSLHRHLAWLTAALVGVHVAGHSFLIVETDSLKLLHITPERLLFPAWTLGWIALIGFGLALIGGMVYYKMRDDARCRINFEAFWYCHVIGATVFFVFSAAHGCWRVFGAFPQFWIFVTVMVILVIIDYIGRSRQSSATIVVEECVPIPKFGFELVIRTQLKCKNLSYVRLKIPGMLSLWHPFTVYNVEKTAGSQERKLRFLIQTVSDDPRYSPSPSPSPTLTLELTLTLALTRTLTITLTLILTPGSQERKLRFLIQTE